MTRYVQVGGGRDAAEHCRHKDRTDAQASQAAAFAAKLAQLQNASQLEDYLQSEMVPINEKLYVVSVVEKFRARQYENPGRRPKISGRS